jgi:carboxypeptidase Taq
MNEKLKLLKEKLAELSDLIYTAAVLDWDQQVNMPPGGAEERGNQLGTVARIIQEKATAPELGKLLDDLLPYANSLDADSDDARIIKVNRKDFEKATHVPPAFVEKNAQTTTTAQQSWREARQKSDFAIFRPDLEKVMELRKEYISFFPGVDHPYDALLDDFEPGMKTADVKVIFAGLRPKQVELIHAIAAKPQVDDSFLHQPLMRRNSGRSGWTSSPSLATTGTGDARIKPRTHSPPTSGSTMCVSRHAWHLIF